MIFNFADDNALSATAAVTSEITTSLVLEIVWVFSLSKFMNKIEYAQKRDFKFVQ